MKIVDAYISDGSHTVHVTVSRVADPDRPWHYVITYTDGSTPSVYPCKTALDAFRIARDQYRANIRFGYRLIDNPLIDLAHAGDGVELIKLDGETPDWVRDLK